MGVIPLCDSCRQHDENKYPHSPDVLERETSDNGFSKGWGMHFLPSEKYWIDSHCHLEEAEEDDLRGLVDHHLKNLQVHNIKQMVTILPMDGDRTPEEHIHPKIWNNKHCLWLKHIHYRRPDLQLLRKGLESGIRGIKLHNRYLIMEGAAHDLWLSKEWESMFQIMEARKVPVLWHVTQRLTGSPYTNGLKNLFWKKGHRKGITYTNEDLVKVFLQVVEAYPDISFIAAHQLHLGWDRLAGLFEQYGNLFIDTSVGCYVRKHDEIYDHDREYIRDYFIRYSERILFGTDLMIRKDNSPLYIASTYEGHINFIKQLRLPYDVLQQISHGNAERLFGMK
jgi:predicted TIM-barrel fold metal-dependent hydrolase